MDGIRSGLLAREMAAMKTKTSEVLTGVTLLPCP